MRRISAAVVAVFFLTLGACSSPEPDLSVTTAPQPAATPTGDGTITREVELRGEKLTLDVHPIAVSGDSALLTIDVAMSSSSTAEGVWLDSIWGDDSGLNLAELRLVDLAGGHVWLTAESPHGGTLSTGVDGLVVKPGAPTTARAVFGAPGSATSLDVLLPYFGFVEDVPVVGSTDISADLSDLGVDAQTVYRSAALESFTAAYDSSARTAVTGDAATIALSSDVLFATDQFVLTDAAGQVVDSAAAQIRSAGAGGEVNVIGHTDDVGTDAYNQDLSVKRAEAVAARLTPILGSAFTVHTDGRGESDPAIDGTSDEARAANRRVTVDFTAQQPGQALEVATGAVAPEPTGAVGSGAAPVVATAGTGDSYSIAASVERRDGFLVGTLSVTRVAGKEDGFVQSLLASSDPGPETALHFSALDVVSGAVGVTLLGQASRYFPSVYTSSPTEQFPRHVVLADRAMDVVTSGTPSLVTVVWPDTGQDTVTIDVQGRFRITDVPVED